VLEKMIIQSKRLLEYRFVYDTFQTCVGSYSYRNKVIASSMTAETSKVLDLGCGTGMTIPRISERVRYVGIEMSQAYANYASGRREDLDIRIGDVADPQNYLNLELGKSDVVFALGLFHHLDDKTLNKMFENLVIVLKGGARLISIDPYVDHQTTKFATFVAQNDRGQYLRSNVTISKVVEEYGLHFDYVVDRKVLNIPADILRGEIRLKANN
jgi:SAM-dependent methyltransferase